MSLNKFLTGIANAIRTKEESSEKINAQAFEQRILNLSGGATITKPGGWVGTPVPNSGYVEKVYFNTALSVEEVVGLLETLTMPSDDDPLTLVNIQSVKTIAAFYSSEMNVWAIVDLLNETFYFTTMDVGGGFVGWNPNISYPISINGETTPVNAGIDDLAIELNKISSLFSTTPFTQVGGEQVLLEGDYDGSTLILDEFPKVIWSGTPVPNSGYVEKVYINTNLTTEEVVEITRNIPITYILAASNAADNSNWLKYPFLYITRGNGQFVIMGCESGGSLKGYFNYGGEGDFIGWNPEFNGEFIVDHEVYPEHTDTGDTFGVYNEQLSSLFSTTPFVKSEANVINVKSLIEQKKIPLEIKVNVDPFNNLEFEKTTIETFTGSTIETFNYQFDNNKNFNDFIQLLTSGNTINGLLPIMVLGFPDGESCYFLENPGQSSQDGVLNVLIYDIVSMSVNFKFGVGDTNIYLFDVTAEGTSILTDIVSGLSSLKIKYLK